RAHIGAVLAGPRDDERVLLDGRGQSRRGFVLRQVAGQCRRGGRGRDRVERRAGRSQRQQCGSGSGCQRGERARCLRGHVRLHRRCQVSAFCSLTPSPSLAATCDQKRTRPPRRAIRAGRTPVMKPNDGPDWKFAPVGVAEFSTLKTSTSTSNRRPPPSGKSLLPRRLTMFCAASCWRPYGSRRIVVLPFCAMGGPPSRAALRKSEVRCPITPVLPWKNPAIMTFAGRR